MKAILKWLKRGSSEPVPVLLERVEVPERLNRNSPNVVKQWGPPEQTGEMLLSYMAERIGIPSLQGLDILDFGCGSRFTEAIINRKIPIGTYTGVDLDSEVISWMQENVRDPRFRFAQALYQNHVYAPDGEPLDENSLLPIAMQQFDIICMFSVITHQRPSDATNILRMLRRYIKPDGKLFFSAAASEKVAEYREGEPDMHHGLCEYNPEVLEKIIRASGWSIVSAVPDFPRNLPIMDSYLCVPA